VGVDHLHLVRLGALVVLLVTFTDQPVLATGLAVTVVVGFAVVPGARSLGTLADENDAASV
jgi:hypothetical protein